ncbi:MAG: hypothetical protein LBC97_05440 [Bifidobacteriaceae bacterium]|jgi:hypothetical protein|nr:hypothetical protein [Bifidobacteriaceae bacterium]
MLRRVLLAAAVVFAGLASAGMAAPEVLAADSDDRISGGIIVLGLMVTAAGPWFYRLVKSRYSLTDEDDEKDQAIGSSCVVRQALQSRGRDDWAISRRYLKAGSPIYVEFVAPNQVIPKRVGRQQGPAPRDTRAQQAGVGVSR